MCMAEPDNIWKYVDIKTIKDKLHLIVEKYKPEKIILFGSYATGNPNPDSDVDLLFILETGEVIYERT